MYVSWAMAAYDYECSCHYVLATTLSFGNIKKSSLIPPKKIFRYVKEFEEDMQPSGYIFKILIFWALENSTNEKCL